MRLAICTPVFNKFSFTKSYLTDLFRLPQDIEIIVLDNASTDETETELRKITNPNFHYIRSDINGGFAYGSNKAYSQSTADKILFLNNDIRVKDDKWINTLIDAIEDDYLVGTTGGMVDVKNDFKFMYETSDSQKPINYVSGWLLAATRTTFDKLNIPRENNQPQIFSEEFGLAYFEDTDCSFRAKQLGIKFKLIDLPIVHFGKITSKQLNTNKLYSEARQIFLNKWKQSSSPLTLK